MKHILLSTIACAIASLSIAQSDINIEISHKLNGDDFNFSQMATNSLGEEFEVDRLEYYLSGFSITHDGGQETAAPDLYVLADAGTPTAFNFGALDADHIDSFTFFIGVDHTNNHTDPATWPSTHALYPQNPSMHWGWAAGYRFLALEGVELASDQIFQLHGLEDNNYFSVTIPIDLDITAGDITLQINGNYENILNDISIAQGPIVHGGYGEAQAALENMAADVFEFQGIALGISDEFPDASLIVAPNPTTDGNARITVDGINRERVDFAIFDIVGRKVFEKSGVSTGIGTDITLSTPGLYIVQVSTNGTTIGTQKLVVQ